MAISAFGNASRVLDTARPSFGRVDSLVNTQVLLSRSRLPNTTAKELQRAIGTNLAGFLLRSRRSQWQKCVFINLKCGHFRQSFVSQPSGSLPALLAKPPKSGLIGHSFARNRVADAGIQFQRDRSLASEYNPAPCLDARIPEAGYALLT